MPAGIIEGMAVRASRTSGLRLMNSSSSGSTGVPGGCRGAANRLWHSRYVFPDPHQHGSWRSNGASGFTRSCYRLRTGSRPPSCRKVGHTAPLSSPRVRPKQEDFRTLTTALRSPVKWVAQSRGASCDAPAVDIGGVADITASVGVVHCGDVGQSTDPVEAGVTRVCRWCASPAARKLVAERAWKRVREPRAVVAGTGRVVRGVQCAYTPLDSGSLCARLATPRRGEASQRAAPSVDVPGPNDSAQLDIARWPRR